LLFAGAFVSGQLSGQLFRRSVVGLFAAPVTLWGLAMIAGLTLSLYPTFVWSAWLAMVMLWGVTLRLARRWLEGRRDAGYYGRLCGWVGLSLAVLFGSIAAVRYGTTPPRNPAWRTATAIAAKAVPPAERFHRSVQLVPQAGSLSRQFAADDLRETIDQVLSDPDAWRRAWLLRNWLAYQRAPEFNPFSYANGGRMRRVIPDEQWRTSNLIDRAVRISLEQLEQGLPPAGSPAEAQRLAAWQALLQDDQPNGALQQVVGTGGPLPTIHWTPARDAQAARLRR